jgi:hypothetical protein
MVQFKSSESVLSSPIHFNLLLTSTINLTCSICQGILAGVPFFDEVFRQLDCRYIEVALVKNILNL